MTRALANRDYAAARRLLFPLARRGDAQAQYRLGMLLADPDLPDTDAEAARFWLRAAADQGHAGAARQLQTLGQPKSADVQAQGWQGRLAPSPQGVLQGAPVPPPVAPPPPAVVTDLTAIPVVPETGPIQPLRPADPVQLVPPSPVPFAPPTPAPPLPAPQAGRGWWVQLASLPDAEAAERERLLLARRWATFLDGLALTVRPVDLGVQQSGAKGRWFRIQTDTSLSRDTAERLCAALRQQGQPCILQRSNP